jgi:hypothetical protein
MSLDGPLQTCTTCTWDSHPVGTSVIYHVIIPMKGCPTHPWGVFPPPLPPCTCTRNPTTGELTHDPNCLRHQ